MSHNKMIASITCSCGRELHVDVTSLPPDFLFACMQCGQHLVVGVQAFRDSTDSEDYYSPYITLVEAETADRIMCSPSLIGIGVV